MGDDGAGSRLFDKILFSVVISCNLTLIRRLKGCAPLLRSFRAIYSHVLTLNAPINSSRQHFYKTCFCCCDVAVVVSYKIS